jgi:hypothetical protein
MSEPIGTGHPNRAILYMVKRSVRGRMVERGKKYKHIDLMVTLPSVKYHHFRFVHFIYLRIEAAGSSESLYQTTGYHV